MVKIRTDEEEELRERFGQFYSDSKLPVNQRIEKAVCGCCYGGVSWATRDEIDEIGKMLALGPGDQLMDLGAGTGWPGLYLAQASGCDVTLSDLPLEGLVIAAERAKADDLAGAVHLAVADGEALPCKDKSFDAITHSDVLCCLPGKLEVLRECRRVIKDEGQMVFSVIYSPQGLGEKETADVIAAGPPFIVADMSYEDMFALSGWSVKAKTRKTDEYLVAIKTSFRISAESDASFEPGGRPETLKPGWVPAVPLLLQLKIRNAEWVKLIGPDPSLLAGRGCNLSGDRDLDPEGAADPFP